MTEPSGGELRAAYEAIRAEDLARARDILSSYLVDHPNDPDGWWLYAHAVSDAAQGLKALETVVKLDPKYPGAQALLDQAETFDIESPQPEPPVQVRALSAKPEGTRSAAPATAETRSSGRRLPIWLVAIVLVFILVAAIALLLPRLSGGGNGQAATAVADATETPLGAVAGATEIETPQVTVSATEIPETVAPSETPQIETTVPTDQPTEAPSETPIEPTSVATDESGGVEPTALPSTVLETALGGFAVISGSEVLSQTTLGTTSVVDVCADTGSLRTLIPSVITALGSAAPQVPQDIGGVAVRFVDCNASQSLLRYVGISSADARAYSAGEIDEDTLRTRIVVNP